MKEDSSVIDKIALIWEVMRQGLINWELSRLYYQSISV